MPGGVQRNLQAAGEQPVPQGAQLPGRHLGTQRSGQLRAQRRVRLLRLHGVQPLRRSGVRGELSDGRHAEGRGNRHRVDRSRGVHRLQDVPDRVPLRCADVRRRSGLHVEVRHVQGRAGSGREQAPLRHRLPYARARFRHARGHDREVRRGRRRGGAPAEGHDSSEPHHEPASRCPEVGQRHRRAREPGRGDLPASGWAAASSAVQLFRRGKGKR